MKKKNTNNLLKSAQYGGHAQYGEIARFAAGLADQPDEEILAAVRAKFGEPIKPLSKVLELPEHVAVSSFAEDAENQQGALLDAASFARIPGVTDIALMPDLHRTRVNNAPVGMVLRTDGVLIPGAIGNDPGCSVMLTVIPSDLASADDLHHPDFRNSLLFGMQKANCGPRVAPWDDETFRADLWNSSLWQLPALKRYRALAESQIGTIGNGNHFITAFALDVTHDIQPGLRAGDSLLAIATHFGARGLGAKVIDYYTKLAVAETQKLGYEADGEHAWFEAGSDLAGEFFNVYQLLEQYALLGHRLVVDRIIARMNFWHNGRDYLAQFATTHNGITGDADGGFTHRKGAAPALKGQIGIIPGTCGTPGALVVGGGDAGALFSTNHGAGREKSRSQAAASIDPVEFETYMKTCGITHQGVTIDESPMAYRSIDAVMKQVEAHGLAERVGILTPRVVYMNADE